MEAVLEELVRRRAKERCEYCHYPAAYAELPFQIDHIIARQHGGETVLENLALACCYCNRYKGPNISGIDPLTRKLVQLFHPREQSWSDHFQWDGPLIKGKTPTGRTTIQVLNLNRSDAVAVRALLLNHAVYPP
jgi:5-methylcytosine-specific restriction endonuclease McrA